MLSATSGKGKIIDVTCNNCMFLHDILIFSLFFFINTFFKVSVCVCRFPVRQEKPFKKIKIK